jgi:hypothetical protein
MEQYITSIAKLNDDDSKRKLVGLSYEYMNRCRDLGDNFYELVYNHLHDALVRYKDYNLLLLLDQLVRQFKYFKKLTREDCDKLFMNVFS